MALTKKQIEALKKRLKPWAACARKLGVSPGKKWTSAEKSAIRACVLKKRKR